MAAETTAGVDAETAAGQATGATHTGDSRFSDVRSRADINNDEAWAVNQKRTYDITQTYDTDSALRARQAWEERVSASSRQQEELHQQRMSHNEDLHTARMRMLQNSLDNDNMLSKQAIAHRDIAIDRTWNVDEVAAHVAKTPMFSDAVAAEVAKASQGGE